MTEAELKERLERAKAKILAGQENMTVEEVVENVMPEAFAALGQWQGELRQTGLPEADIEIKIGRLLGRVFHPGWATPLAAYFHPDWAIRQIPRRRHVSRKATR